MGKPGDSNPLKTCCVPQCKSRQTNDISLFLIPKDETLKKRWADAIKSDKRITPNMQVCSRHFTKNDYLVSGTTKKLKKSAVPTQNLPWQHPNKHVSPTLVKARMERLKNRTQLKTPDAKTGGNKQVTPESTESSTDGESVQIKSEEDPFDKLLDNNEDAADKNKSQTTAKKEKTSQQALKKSAEPENKETTMPERAPTRLRQSESVLKCELCGRKCLTPQALRTHQEIAHRNVKSGHSDLDDDPLVTTKAKESPKPTPKALIAVKRRESLMEAKSLKKSNSAETPSKIGSLVEQVLRDDDSGSTDVESDDSGEINEKYNQLKMQRRDKRKIEFECPKCKKRFAVLFSARKHIEKHHTGAQKVDKPNPLPPELRPVRIELCTICSMVLTSNIHLCAGPLKLAHGFICTACDQEFKTLALFDMHKSGMHSDGVESMFFPSLDEFENWKLKMMAQTKTSYNVLDQNDVKKTHRCTYLVNSGIANNRRSRMCPSSIIVQEFSKGFQVHYYPNHYGHDSITYNLTQVFSKYSIASLMNITASQLPDDSDDDDLKETDLYLQFRKLTEYLVNDAARINVRGLKLLVRKALEMMTIINNYNEDEDCLSLSDADDDLKEQVKSALRRFKRPQLKRPNSNALETSMIKRIKPVFQSTENTLKETTKPVQPTKKETSRPVQPNPKKETSKPVQPSPTVTKTKVGNENVNGLKEAEKASEAKNSTSFIDSFQEFVGKSREIVKRTRRSDPEKKETVRTKIGQFKPSPKKSSPPTVDPITPTRKSTGSVKDIEYEVKEQENDCNILILKI